MPGGNGFNPFASLRAFAGPFIFLESVAGKMDCFASCECTHARDARNDGGGTHEPTPMAGA
jgi:hypothetical protein